ncbi:metal-sensitive transcriptional repressor family protein [Spiractinospora alimapuensis]|uniref:metal-sensitive transcriptional repressor family protein n=1 Tax=Spiractinospora alimapuensis TaxID=2820884 RepID=UPI001F463583|nr:metal-sensitive transcriptional repressor family protein [Spiractinospora alimapuensis]QVQ53321.1 metal-sensitive transcriptional repressor family protein [Spiractinospora alimapuensis]
MNDQRTELPNRRAAALERSLRVPVLVAAILSVPAVLCAQLATGTVAYAGSVVNLVSGLVLWAEWILLILLAENKRAWLRDHAWAGGVALATVPSVALLLGPVQILRVVLAVMALPITRLTRITEAGTVIPRRMGLSGAWRATIVTAAIAVTAVVAVLLLTDPHSDSRVLWRMIIDGWDPWRLLLSAALITGAGAALTGYYWRRSRTP